MKLVIATVSFATIVASLIALPTPPPTPPLPAAPAPVVKTERPVIQTQPAGSPCAQQNWPNFDAACLRYTNDKQTVRGIRTVGDQS